MKNLINWLNFRNMLTPMIIKGWFWVFSGFVVLAALFSFVSAASSPLYTDTGVFEAWGTALAVPVVFGWFWTMIRIATEFVLVVFGIHDELKEMNDRSQ